MAKYPNSLCYSMCKFVNFVSRRKENNAVEYLNPLWLLAAKADFTLCWTVTVGITTKKLKKCSKTLWLFFWFPSNGTNLLCVTFCSRT